MGKKSTLKPGVKVVAIALVLLGIIFGVKQTGLLNKILPKDKTEQATNNSKDAKKPVFAPTKDGKRPIRIGVVTWGGYAGGEYFNRGFKPNPESQYKQKYGLDIEFCVVDDFNQSRDMFKNDELDLLWTTIDSFPVEAKGLGEFGAKIVFQADWSRGGDAIVANQGIETVADLKGKKISVATGTPSHTFLLMTLQSAGINLNDVKIVEVPSAVDSATAFKNRTVDCAVVWSPDDADCVKSINGSKVLVSTKEATNIISDVFMAKDKFIQNNQKELKAIIEGWMIGAEEANQSDDAKKKAAKILSEGLNMPEDFCLNAINNVRLANLADNKQFFGIDTNYTGMTAEALYNKMSKNYSDIKLADKVPGYRNIIDTKVLQTIQLDQKPEQAKVFKAATEEDKTKKAVSSKKVSITFAVGSSDLDANVKRIIDMEMGDLLKMFGSQKIRVEGNTDNTGDANLNKALSYKRAESVVNYLVNTYKLDKNRFVVVGNGSDAPVADNNTEDGRNQNRRTEFQFITE